MVTCFAAESQAEQYKLLELVHPSQRKSQAVQIFPFLNEPRLQVHKPELSEAIDTHEEQFPLPDALQAVHSS